MLFVVKRILVLIVLWVVFFPTTAHATENSRFITVVHPVRGRTLWSDLDLLVEHAATAHTRDLPVTWLLRYDTLSDTDLIDTIKTFETDEVGVFLEVTEELATPAGVAFPIGYGDWAHADRIFFSAYEIRERRRMADELFETFKSVFGHYPTSVGAWYIDPVTLEYIVDTYGVTAAVTVADQYSTDGYQIWGSPWGVPYYPSRWSSITPAQSVETKLPVVVVQWALRDPLRAYGPGVLDSTFSLQANDYVGHQQLTTDYFDELLTVYLETENPISQATVGLEVGTESQFLPELDRQMASVARRVQSGVQAVILREFARRYQQRFPTQFPDSVIATDTAVWYSSPWYRLGLVVEQDVLKVRDIRIYDDTYLEPDAVAADARRRLYRQIYAPVDNLLYQNGRVLDTAAGEIVVERRDRKVVISWDSNQSLILNLRTAYIGDTVLVDAHSGPDIGFVAKLQKRISMIAAQLARLDLPEYHRVPLRYTKLGDRNIVGIQTEKDRLYALSFPPPRLGFLQFSFQHLVRFKTWPTIQVLDILFTPDSARNADWFVDTLDQDRVQVFDRARLTPEKSQQLHADGWQRVFENSVQSIWQQK